jgi:hypothetical protein
LRAILPDTDTEVTEHKDTYPSKELVNKEHIQEDQEASRYSIEELKGQEYSSGSIQGIDQPPYKCTVILTPAPTPALSQLRRSRRLGEMNRVIATGASVEQGKLTSYREALAQDYTQKWGEAIHAELRSLELNET